MYMAAKFSDEDDNFSPEAVAAEQQINKKIKTNNNLREGIIVAKKPQQLESSLFPQKKPKADRKKNFAKFR